MRHARERKGDKDGLPYSPKLIVKCKTRNEIAVADSVVGLGFSLLQSDLDCVGATLGVRVSSPGFLASDCHECSSASSSLGWGLIFRALVCKRFSDQSGQSRRVFEDDTPVSSPPSSVNV